MAEKQTSGKSAAERRSDKENPSGDAVKRSDVQTEATKGVKEPIDPAQAPQDPVGSAADPEVAAQEQERLEAGEKQVERDNIKNTLDAERELFEQAQRDGLKSVEPIVDQIDHSTGEREDATKAVELQNERMLDRLTPRRIDGLVRSMEQVELEIEPLDVNQRRFTANVIVHGEIDDGYLVIRTTDEERIPGDYKKGRVYESPRFGTKNRLRTTTDADGKTVEYTDLGKFQTTPIRLAPGNYTVVLETTGGKKVATADFTLLGDAVDAQGEPVPADSPAVVGQVQAADAQEAHALQQRDVTGADFLEEEVERQQARFEKQDRAAKRAAKKAPKDEGAE